jgi:hypothetical protein
LEGSFPEQAKGCHGADPANPGAGMRAALLSNGGSTLADAERIVAFSPTWRVLYGGSVVRRQIAVTALMRVAGSAIAGVLIAAPAQALPGWYYNPNTGTPFNLPDTTRPKDEFSQYAPFASYMYGSLLPRPIGRNASSVVASPLYAPEGPFTFPTR